MYIILFIRRENSTQLPKKFIRTSKTSNFFNIGRNVFQLQKPAGKVLVQIARIFKTEATQPPLMQLHHASSTLINVHPTYAN